MGMLNRLLGQASRTATPATKGRGRRPVGRATGRGRGTGRGAAAPAAGGLGAIAQRLLGGRRRSI